MLKIAKCRTPLVLFLVVAVTVSGIALCSIGQEYLSGIEWPEPPVVKPGETSADPPSDAIVLFDGTDLSAWEGGEKWKIEDGAAVVQNGDIKTKQSFGDCQLHIEWSSPVPPTGTGQGRGNSGVFFMDRYELQILDSYENETYFDGQASAIYKQTPPMVNAMRPPGEWNSYDVVFTAPRFKDDGSLESPAYITVLHNGVLTLNHFELLGNTPFNKPPKYEEHGKGPIRLQDHGNPVRFRNIWIREFEPIKGVQEREPFFRDGDKEWPVKKQTTSISGRITFKGEPLQNTELRLHPVAGGRTLVAIVENGNYHFRGVEPGEYVVSLEATDKARDSKIPRRYRNRGGSGIRVQIGAGPNVVDLELSRE